MEIGAAIVIFAGRVRRCNSDKEHEEPCEGRLSRTVLWEGRGEIPLPDPIGRNKKEKNGVPKIQRECERVGDIALFDN